MNLVPKLHLLFDQLAYVLLTCVHLRRHLLLFYIQDLSVKVAFFILYDWHMVREVYIAALVATIDIHVDAEVRGNFLIIVDESHTKDLVALSREVKATNSGCYELPAKINCISLLVLFGIGDLID